MTITLKKIDDKIGTFTTNRDKLRTLADEIAAMIFYHAAPKEVGADCNGSGDCTRALKLMREMPKSWAEQMAAKFREYTPIRVVVKNDKCEYDPAYKKLSAEEKIAAWNMEAFMSTPFWEVMDEPEAAKDPKTLEELIAMVQSLGKRINTMAEDGKVSESDAETAKAMAERLVGFKFKRVKPANNNNATDDSVKENAA